jgi:RNA polymerase sigma-70 factor (ECF subfamily)
MARAQAGDHEAYHTLLHDVAAMLKVFLRRRLDDPDAAADVLQDVLMTMHRGRHTYDPSRPFDPWLFAIVHHALADHVRRGRRAARLEVVSDEEIPDVAAPEAMASTGLLDEALARLPPAQREAFEMLQLEGVSVATAAARAGTTPGALRVRAHRAYKALREILARS